MWPPIKKSYLCPCWLGRGLWRLSYMYVYIPSNGHGEYYQSFEPSATLLLIKDCPSIGYGTTFRPIESGAPFPLRNSPSCGRFHLRFREYRTESYGTELFSDSQLFLESLRKHDGGFSKDPKPRMNRFRIRIDNIAFNALRLRVISGSKK